MNTNILNNLRMFILYVIEFIFGLIEIIIASRILLELFGASSNSSFSNWIFNNSSSLIAPFSGTFPVAKITGSFVIDFSTLLAFLVYGIIGYFLIGIFTKPFSQISIPSN